MNQDCCNILAASTGPIPAIFQKDHPAGGPANFPMAIRQSAGGLCKPRSQRDTTMEEQFSRFAKSI
jgi:hypothetical protein